MSAEGRDTEGEGSNTPKVKRREDVQSEIDSSVRNRTEDTFAEDAPNTAAAGRNAGSSRDTTSARRSSREEGRRRSSGSDSVSIARKASSDGTNRPTFQGIFGESDEDSSVVNFDDADADEETPSPRPRDGSRRRSSQASASPPRKPTGSRGEEKSPGRKSVSRERRRGSRPGHQDSRPRRGRPHNASNAPSSLSQTQHATKALVAMGAGGSGSRRPKTRVELKEQGRVREWASFCRRKTYLSLEDLSREERPRVARKGAVTPFALQLMKVEGWQVPSILVERTRAADYGLRFSLSVSFYHAGSKRFYGDTFMGDLLNEEDEERVSVVSEKTRGNSSTKKGTSRKRNSRWKGTNSRASKGRGKGTRGDTGDGDDEEGEMEVNTKHEELVYWYTGFEDPNCIAVVELVATIMDIDNGVQVGQYGCGWTFIQFFGPNEPEAVQHRDVYRGSPRNLLFFEQGDWGGVGETAIPGCSIWFTLSLWESLLRSRHLFRPDEIVCATDVLPGMQTRQIAVPDKEPKFGPFLGLRIEEGSTRPQRRGRGRNSAEEGRWSVSPARPRLAVCLEFRLSALRVIIPSRDGYEKDLLKGLGEDIPEQEIVKTTTTQHSLGFSTTQREVVTGVAGEKAGRGGGSQRAKIVDRRAKIGFHNGHTLVLPHEWVETHLEETDDDDVLMLPEEVPSLSVDGYVPHPLFALVVLVEYTIRTRPKNAAGRGGGGRAKKGDPLSKAQAELSNTALPVVVGMQVFVPYDGKRLRLRNTPRHDEDMDIGLRLAADRKVRLVTTELVYTNKKHLLDEAHGGASDDEDGRGPKMVCFDLKAYDSSGKVLEDETPASGDESPLEASGWEPPKQAVVESSDGATSPSISSTSSESSSESSDSEESDVKSTPPPKKKKPKPPTVKPTPPKVKRKRPARKESSSDSSSSESTTPSLVTGDSDASSLRRPRPSKKRNAHVQTTETGWDDWRKSVKVPRRSESLMGQTLQAPLHAEASAQTARMPDREPELSCYGPEAVVVGGFAPLAHDLSRASRTRLSRHGFTDVMKDTVDSFAQSSRDTLAHRRIPIDLDLEATDPLAKHEITLQFAAFRAAPDTTKEASNASAGGDRGVRGRGGMLMPSSLYFTYQFYTCLPTRTERMVLRPDAPRDKLYQAEGGGASRLSIFVREGRYGHDEPSLGLRHSIDTTTMQPFEAQAFATYMAGGTLFVDVWDADALMHVGALAVPLRTLMRQQKGVVKTAMEYEVVANTGAVDDCGRGGGMAVKHGMVAKGPVVGLVQILASNYGEPGQGGDLPASGAVPAIVHPVASGPSIRGDWRLAAGPAGTMSGAPQRGTRPRYKVRARPLADNNPELSKYMEVVTGPGAGGGAIVSLARRGRGDIDADSMGYDELMLLVRRFRGSVKGRVWYAGPLLRLLDVPGRKQLEQRLVRAVERSERSGLGLAEAFRSMDQQRTGELSTHDLEEMFWGMLLPGEMAREHVNAVVKSMDPGATGKVGLRELVTFVRARQGGGGSNAGRAAETALRRMLARAELGGNSAEETFYRLDDRGKDSLSHAEFWEAVRTLGGLPGVVKSDLNPLLRLLDTMGDGRVSLPALMDWAGRDVLSAAGVENAARKKLLRAEAAALRNGQKTSIQQALLAEGGLASAVKTLGNVNLTLRETAALHRRFETEGRGVIDIPAVLRFFGREELRSTPSAPADTLLEVATDQQEEGREEGPRQDLLQAEEEEEQSSSVVERKLKNIILKAESMGTSLAETFGVFDKDGSGFITASKLEDGLRGLGVFESIPKDEVFSLIRKLTTVRETRSTEPSSSDQDEMVVSVEEFVQFVGGEYEAADAAQARLRNVLTLAEEREGVTLEAAFEALDKNGTGRISTSDLEEGLRQLNVFDGMSREQAFLATKRFDQNGDGTISLPEFLAFVGKPYAANDRPLEAKLRRVLLKAESMGTSMEEAFKHFDKDGCGSITAEGFATGLREMGVFQEFSEEEVQQVIVSFGTESDGGVSLPKFLLFLGKEYGRGGRFDGGKGGGRSLGRRLRLILQKANELGTPLSASFEGFGADAKGHLSVQALHRALKDIGQFRWTTLGEVKNFIRLLQEDDVDATTECVIPHNPGRPYQDSTKATEPFLTLPALQAFVEGGDDFLARKEHAALVRQQDQEVPPPTHVSQPTTASPDTAKLTRDNAVSSGISRKSSWAEGQGFQDGGNGETVAAGGEMEEELLEHLRDVLSRAPGTRGAPDTRNNVIVGAGSGVRGHLDSFDVDSDGKLSREELSSALRSLGARGGDFHGRGGVNALVSRFRDGDGGSKDGEDGASVVKISWWFDEQALSAVPRKDNATHRGGADEGVAKEGGDQGQGCSDNGRISGFVAGEALRRAVRLAEAKGTTLERTFARLDDDGDGFITLRQLLRGLDQLGVFEQATRDDVLDALDVLDADRQSSRSPKERRNEESKDGGGGGAGGNGGVDLVAFIRLMRQGAPRMPGVEEGKTEGTVGRGEGKQSSAEEGAYEFSLDAETRAAEKKLRRVVGKQVRMGVDVEDVFRRYDPEQTGSVLRSDFVQAVMQLGVGLLESVVSRNGTNSANATRQTDPVRQRQLGQLARAKGPVERRLIRMRQSRRALFERAAGGGGEAKREARDDPAGFEGGDETLALVQWYREGQKKSMVQHILATSLTTEYNLFFAFASPLFFEHPLRNPFNHEERFRIDLDDYQLRVVTATAEWEYLRRHSSPCVGEVGDSPLETEFFDLDPQRGIQVTLMAHEVVFIPFAFLSLEPRRPLPAAATSPRKRHSSGRGGRRAGGGREGEKSAEGGAGAAERSVVVGFVSTSHGHVVSVMQVHLQRRAFAVNRTFRFYQNEGEILKRSIRLLPGGGAGPRLSTPGNRSRFGVGGLQRESQGMCGDQGEKYVHCVEEAGEGGGDTGGVEGGVVIEWARRPVVGSGDGSGGDVQEVLVKCRIGRFPARKSFYLLVYDDHFEGSLYETWHVIVEARLRMDVHSLLGQQSPADLVVRGDRYSRKVRAFSSAPDEVSFEPQNAFQLVPGAYNRVEVRFQPLSIGSRKIHVHLVDVDSMEIVGAWLATATAMPPVVTKSYEVDLPVGRACHKRIAYSNPWTSTRLFRLSSSDPNILRPRYESLEVAGGGTGYLRLWFEALGGASARKEAFLFVNDSEGQNEECLLIKLRGV